MLNNRILILNFDDSVVKQKKLVSGIGTDIIDFKDIGAQARHWINTKTRGIIQKRINDSAKNSAVFLGSGDFHHISEILISRYSQPLCVIIFDLHPDWSILPPQYGCGSWVNRVLEKDNIAKLISLGVSSEDISSFTQIQTGNIDSLKNSRVEIYPYEHAPTRTFLKKIPTNVSVITEKGTFFNKIYWNELKNQNIDRFISSLLNRIPEEKVYISIDKDCLQNSYALTNWEEGKLGLDELLKMLALVKQKKDIVGLDITGDYSPVQVKGLIKKIAVHFDHPRHIAADNFSEPDISFLNEGTNLKILHVLGL